MNDVILKMSILFLMSLVMASASGCSCGGDDSFKKIDHRSSRTYDSDAEDEGFRKQSRLSSVDGSKRYYGSGVDIMKKKEKSAIIEKLQFDGRKALKNKNFVEAEKLFSEGNYQEALKLYSTAGAAGNNSYIERRALACKVSIDRVSTLQNEEIKKATALLSDGRPGDAVGMLDHLEKQGESANDNIYLKQSVSGLKINAYSQMGDNKKLIEEYIKQEKISKQLSETLSKSWTVPIE